MKRYKDERLQSEMEEIQAKLFRYMIYCFMIIYLIKLNFLNNYSQLEQSLDNFILLSTVLYAGYLEFKSKSDFYRTDKLIRPIIGAIVVGLFVMLIPMKENNFQLSEVYLVSYGLTFINGVLIYVFAFVISRGIRKVRHNNFEKQLDKE